MQGRTYAPGEVADELAEAMKEFNAFVRKDPRVDVVALPFRDGISIITRRWIHFNGELPAYAPHAGMTRAQEIMSGK